MKYRIFALYITHRAVNQAGVCKIILHATAYFFYGIRRNCTYKKWRRRIYLCAHRKAA